MYNNGQEATKRNHAMLRRPSYIKTMAKYHKDGFGIANSNEKLTKEEQKKIETRMRNAERKGILKELSFFFLLSCIIGGAIYYLFYLFG